MEDDDQTPTVAADTTLGQIALGILSAETIPAHHKGIYVLGNADGALIPCLAEEVDPIEQYRQMVRQAPDTDDARLHTCLYLMVPLMAHDDEGEPVASPHLDLLAHLAHPELVNTDDEN